MTETSNSIHCPKCCTRNEINAVTVLHEGDEALNDLFAGRLNVVRCKQCEAEYLFETPILYRDDPNRHMLYYLPRTMVENRDEAIRQMRDLFETVFADFSEADRPECRLARRRNQFIEKIAVHRYGFDDRLIEYVKYQLYQNAEGLDHVRHELLFDFGNTNDDEIGFLAFDRDTGKAVYAMTFGREDYQNLDNYFLQQQKMTAELDRMFKPYHIEVDDLL